MADWKERRRLAQLQQTKMHSPQPQQKNNNATVADEVGINNMIYREPDDTWNGAWRVTEGLITEMRDEVRQRGAKFLFVTLSSDIQVYPNKIVRQAFMQRIGVNDLFYPDRRLQSLAERERIAFLNLAQPMQDYADQNGVFLHGFGSEIGNGHWNANGHKLAGELISRKLCEEIKNGWQD